MSVSDQFDIFGAPGEAGPRIPPAESEELPDPRQLGLPSSVRLGTSSWAFPGWEGIVYRGRWPRSDLSGRGLSAYTDHPIFRTVGLDRSYYGPVPGEELARYREQVPDDFRFLAKLERSVTLPTVRGDRGWEANPAFLDPSVAAEAARRLAEGLGEKLGVLLVQFSPMKLGPVGGLGSFLQGLGALLEGVGAGLHSGGAPGAVMAVELRSPEALVPEYARLLRERGAEHGYTVHPSMPSLRVQRERLGEAVSPGASDSLLSTRGPRVIRWMLGGGRRYEEARDRYDPFDRLVDPDPGTRAEVADLVVESARVGAGAYVIVNNKAEGSSPLSVAELIRTIAARFR